MCTEILGIIFVIQQMLLSDNADPVLVEEQLDEFIDLSKAIVQHSEEWEQDPLRMVAVGFQESRFGYRVEEFEVVSHSGACGPFQQIPRYARPYSEPVTCEELFDPYEAAYRLGAKLNQMEDRWGEGRLDETICHYYEGNVCTEEEGHRYARDHRGYYHRAQGYYLEFGSITEEEFLEFKF